MTDELQNIKDTSQADILQNLLHNFLSYSERERRKQNWTEIKKGADFDCVMLFKKLLETGYKNQKQVNYYAKEINITEKRLNLATAKPNPSGHTMIDGATELKDLYKTETNKILVRKEHFGKDYDAFYDLFRVENGKIAEYWDTIEPIAAKENWKNNNRKF